MKNKILIFFVVIIAIILAIPSILYLINNKTVDGFDAYYTYTLVKSDIQSVRIKSAIIVIGLLMIFGILYVEIIKKENEIFDSVKKVFIFVFVISFIFMMIIPYLSSDIYYYIGDSWISAKYGENPYYTSVSELQENGINDEILNNTGYWKDTTSIYGPLWNSVAKLLVSFSFGNVTIALFIFKIASYLIHVLNSYLIYKITKSCKYTLLYGLNPLVLVEFLSNVHNDIYLVLFILLALYFLTVHNNKLFTIIFIALSVSVKYSTVLIVPFILIYCFKDKTLPKRILYCLMSGISIIALVVLLYLPYYRDYTIFTNMLVQGEKYSQSIMLLLTQMFKNDIFSTKLILPIFAIIYITFLIFLLLKKDINMKEIMKDYNFIMLVFIFIVLTNFQKWYILWLLPTIMWQTEKMQKFIIYLTITAIIPSFGYFLAQGDPWTVGIGYSAKILIISITLLIIDIFENKILIMKNAKKLKYNN